MRMQMSIEQLEYYNDNNTKKSGNQNEEDQEDEGPYEDKCEERYYLSQCLTDCVKLLGLVKTMQQAAKCVSITLNLLGQDT